MMTTSACSARIAPNGNRMAHHNSGQAGAPANHRVYAYRKLLLTISIYLRSTAIIPPRWHPPQPEGWGFRLLTHRSGGEQLRFAVHRPGIPEASPRSHGVPRRRPARLSQASSIIADFEGRRRIL